MVAEKVLKLEDQLKANVSHYALIYGECQEAARQLVTKDPVEAEELHAIAETLFHRFCQDQADVAKEKMKNAELMKFVGPFLAALERRGLYL